MPSRDFQNGWRPTKQVRTSNAQEWLSSHSVWKVTTLKKRFLLQIVSSTNINHCTDSRDFSKQVNTSHKPQQTSWCTWHQWAEGRSSQWPYAVSCNPGWRMMKRGMTQSSLAAGWWPDQTCSLPGSGRCSTALHWSCGSLLCLHTASPQPSPVQESSITP